MLVETGFAARAFAEHSDVDLALHEAATEFFDERLETAIAGGNAARAKKRNARTPRGVSLRGGCHVGGDTAAIGQGHRPN